MRIKKVSQTTATQAQVVNNTNDSKLNAYSCNYVNNKVKDVYSTDEVKTNKIWIDGKPIYRKVITFTTGNSAGDINIAHNINNAEMFTNVYAFTYRDNDGEERILPNLYKDMQSMYTIVVYSINRTNVQISYGSMRINMNGYIILEYTKKGG